MHEMCVTYGHCGGRRHVFDLLPSEGQLTAENFATLVLEAEEISVETAAKHYEVQHRLISDLFEQHMRSDCIDAATISEFK